MRLQFASIRPIAWAFFLTLALVGNFSLGASADELGPPVGAKLADIGTPPDQTGKPRALSSLMGDKGLVLFFFRSADWCPYCQAQMIDLNTAVAALEQRGYKMAGISYDSPQILSTFIERHPTIKVLALSFLVLVGVALIGESVHVDLPKGYLYFAMAFSATVEWLNISMRKRAMAGSRRVACPI